MVTQQPITATAIPDQTNSINPKKTDKFDSFGAKPDELKQLFFLLVCLTVLAACKKKRPASSSAKSITSFVFRSGDNPSLNNSITASIKADTLYLDVSASVDLSSLKPTIVHTGKSIAPASGLPQNFSNSVVYTVTAEDGSTKRYRTQVRILSALKEITSFVFTKAANPFLPADVTGIITGDTITVTFPAGLSANALIPSISFLGASINPPAAQTGDFSNTFYYTVTAADATTRTYTVFTGTNSDVLIQGKDGYLYNINAINGRLKWKYYTGAESVPTSNNGIVFANGANGELYAIRLADGSLKWKSTAPRGQIKLTIPVVRYGKVYCAGSGDLNYPNSNYLYYAGFVLALNEETGAQEWFSTLNTSYSYQSSANTNVTVENNLVLFYDMRLGLFVFRANDGTPYWDKNGDMLGRGNPLIYNNTIIYSVEGGLRGVSETGQNLWLVRRNSNFSTPTVYNGSVYCTITDSLINFNPNGLRNNAFFLGYNRFFYAPLLYNNMAILSNSYNELRAYSLAGGSIIWERKDVNSYPVAANNLIYIGDANGRLWCLDAATGNSKWSFASTTSFNLAACVIDSKNKVYHSPESGEMH